ncbi:MAG: NlpC/P60 family protein [Microthrixaceae bacterium]
MRWLTPHQVHDAVVGRVSGRRLAAGVLAAVVVPLVPMVGSGAVGAQDSSDLASQVERIKARRAELGEKISMLDEEVNVAKVRLTDLEKRAATNQADVDEAQEQVSGASKDVRNYAIKSFTASPGTEMMGGEADPNTALLRRTLLQTARGNREESIDQVRAARSDLATKQSYLDETSKEIAAEKAKADQARKDMEAAAAELAKEEEQVKGALKVALEREEAARVAAEKAEAERRQAEAEAKAEAEAAARQQTVRAPSSGGSAATGGGSSAGSSAGSSRSSSSGGGSSAPASVAAAAPAPAPAPSSGGGSAVSAALSMRGTPYRWGGESPSGFDCSGLVVWAFRQAGRGGLPHSSRALVAMGRRISVGQLVPGDLVAYGSPVHHIGIYIGGGQYVHSPRTGDVVKVSSIYRSAGSPIAVRI